MTLDNGKEIPIAVEKIATKNPNTAITAGQSYFCIMLVDIRGLSVLNSKGIVDGEKPFRANSEEWIWTK